jgi:hypothetical protein
MNALTHGLTAAKIIVAGEKPEDFDAFREALSSHDNAVEPSSPTR